MNDVTWLEVTLCMQTQVSTGFIYLPPEERLLDLLNGVWGRRPESQSRFLALSNLTIREADGKQERLATAYINKATIHLAAIWDSNSGRGIGAKAGYKAYPFVEKLSLPVKLHLPGYSLTGSMHCASGERASHVLDEKLMFLPLTNVEVRPLANGAWSKVPFVAVNREQILALQEEDIPLLQVEGLHPEHPE
jgi:hypothetical protein